jgi:hypothetical protein
VKRKNLEPNDIGGLMLSLRKQFGPGAISPQRGDALHKIVIDGVRSVPEVSS